MANGDTPRLIVAKCPSEPAVQIQRPRRAEAEEAVRTLICWVGEDPEREGLKDMPSRVARGYDGRFCGYASDPQGYLARTFEEDSCFHTIIVLKDIRFESHSEHLLAPII